MNIEEIKDSLLNNSFTGLRVKLNTVIEFIDEQQVEIETFKQQLVTTSSEAKLNYSKGHEDGRKLSVVKELTAEEINQVAKDCKWDYDEINIVDFARAILKKASEK